MGEELEYISFFRDWHLLAEGRDTDEKRLAFYDAIFRYAFDGEVPEKPSRGESPGKVWAAWDAYVTTHTIIDNLLKKVNAGRAGGKAGKGTSRNVGNTNAKKAETPVQEAENKSKTIAEQKQNNSKDNSKTKHIDINKDIDINIDKTNTCAAAHDVGGSDIDKMFEEFWKVYPGPRKTDKKKCGEKFRRIISTSKIGTSQMFRKIMDGLEVWRVCDTWTKDGGAFIRAPLVWLNNENWNDSPYATNISTPVFGRNKISNILSLGVSKEDENVF